MTGRHKGGYRAPVILVPGVARSSIGHGGTSAFFKMRSYRPCQILLPAVGTKYWNQILEPNIGIKNGTQKMEPKKWNPKNGTQKSNSDLETKT